MISLTAADPEAQNGGIGESDEDEESDSETGLATAERVYSIPLRLSKKALTTQGSVTSSSDNKSTHSNKNKKNKKVRLDEGSENEEDEEEGYGKGGKNLSTVVSLSVSQDQKWACIGDENNYVIILNLISRQFHAILPKLNSPHLNTSFNPSGEKLVVLTASGTTLITLITLGITMIILLADDNSYKFDISFFQFLTHTKQFMCDHTESSDSSLMITLITLMILGKFHVFNTSSAQLSKWSRQNLHLFPHEFLRQKQKPVNVSFDPSNSNILLLQSHSFLCKVDLSLPAVDSKDNNKNGGNSPSYSGSKRSLNQNNHQASSTSSSRKTSRNHLNNSPNFSSSSRSNSTNSSSSSSSSNNNLNNNHSFHRDQNSGSGNGNFRLITQFQPLLYAQYLSGSELLVVESPWLKTMQTFPDTLFRRRYGN